MPHCVNASVRSDLLASIRALAKAVENMDTCSALPQTAPATVPPEPIIKKVTVPKLTMTGKKVGGEPGAKYNVPITEYEVVSVNSKSKATSSHYPFEQVTINFKVTSPVSQDPKWLSINEIAADVTFDIPICGTEHCHAVAPISLASFDTGGTGYSWHCTECLKPICPSAFGSYKQSVGPITGEVDVRKWATGILSLVMNVVPMPPSSGGVPTTQP